LAGPACPTVKTTTATAAATRFQSFLLKRSKSKLLIEERRLDLEC